ncbi:MAG: DNA-binding protein [Candidatus Thermoplasmatota archaeon]|jgi:predicted DNA-binding protein with PD1-like motif|nr:DNA-binding protein [Candidatus Thermoplasmatota archaeon]
MQSSIEGSDIIVKLDSGEDVISSIETICKQYSVKSGVVLWAVGMMRRAELGYFVSPQYDKVIIKERAEVVSFHGSIADDTPKLHVHASVALPDHSVKGGHLFSGIADPLLEIHIKRLDRIVMKRTENPKSGLRELKVE